MAQVIRHILASRPHPEQGYRACLGLLRLERATRRDPPGGGLCPGPTLRQRPLSDRRLDPEAAHRESAVNEKTDWSAPEHAHCAARSITNERRTRPMIVQQTLTQCEPEPGGHGRCVRRTNHAADQHSLAFEDRFACWWNAKPRTAMGAD